MTDPLVLIVESTRVLHMLKTTVIIEAGGVLQIVSAGNLAKHIHDEYLVYSLLITDNVETIKAIRQENNDVFILGLTSEPEDNDAFLAAGATMYHPEILSLETMKQIIKRLPVPEQSPAAI